MEPVKFKLVHNKSDRGMVTKPNINKVCHNEDKDNL